MQLDIPGSYSQITVGQLHDYLTAKTDFERIAAITGEPVEKIKSLPFKAVHKAIEVIAKVLSEEENTFTPIVEIEKRKYGFIPQLDQVTVGEYLDFITFANKENFNNSILQLMTLMYRPVTLQIGKSYQIAPYEIEKLKVHEADIRKISAATFSGCLLFFSTLRNELQSSSLASLQKQTSRLLSLAKKQLRHSQLNGDGITS